METTIQLRMLGTRMVFNLEKNTSKRGMQFWKLKSNYIRLIKFHAMYSKLHSETNVNFYRCGLQIIVEEMCS